MATEYRNIEPTDRLDITVPIRIRLRTGFLARCITRALYALGIDFSVEFGHRDADTGEDLTGKYPTCEACPHG